MTATSPPPPSAPSHPPAVDLDAPERPPSPGDAMVDDPRATRVGCFVLTGLMLLLVLLLWLPPRDRTTVVTGTLRAVPHKVVLPAGRSHHPTLEIQAKVDGKLQQVRLPLRRYRLTFRLLSGQPRDGLLFHRKRIVAHRPGRYRVAIRVQSVPWLSKHPLHATAILHVRVPARSR